MTRRLSAAAALWRVVRVAEAPQPQAELQLLGSYPPHEPLPLSRLGCLPSQPDLLTNFDGQTGRVIDRPSRKTEPTYLGCPKPDRERERHPQRQGRTGGGLVLGAEPDAPQDRHRRWRTRRCTRNRPSATRTRPGTPPHITVRALPPKLAADRRCQRSRTRVQNPRNDQKDLAHCQPANIKRSNRRRPRYGVSVPPPN